MVYLGRVLSLRGLAWAASDVVWYALLATGILWLDSRDRLELQALREVELRAQATRAQLQVLRHRLEPHFLFNALNALSALIRTEPRQAEAMVDDLGELFRRVLVRPDAERVPLSEELALVRSYLDVEAYRFGDALRVSLEVGGDAEGLLVPPLLLQPLVENAIRHGVAPRGGEGWVGLLARRHGTQLRVEVQDDGPGTGGAPGHGLGLASVRERLATLYGEAARLEAGPLPEGGFLALVELPAEPTP